MRTTEYIDRLRTRTETRSDYAVAKLLGVAPEQVHYYAKKGRTMDNTTAAKTAELLNVPVLQVIADMEIERHKNADRATYWTRLRRSSRRTEAKK